jgi:predicted alpha-1,2-mannosidase
MACSLLIGMLTLEAQGQPKHDPVDYVNPRIGALGHLLTGTQPSIQLPYGMVRCVPTTMGGPDAYLAGMISGFPAGGLVLMPTTGPLETNVARYASEFDRDFETVTPYYGSDVLDKYGITVEYTAARRALFFRFGFPADMTSHVLMLAGQDGEITMSGSNVVAGFSGGAARSYFYAIFSRPFTSPRKFTGQMNPGGRRGGGGGGNPSFRSSGTGLSVDFTPRTDEPVTVRIGASNISLDEARSNLLADIPKPSFDAAKASARAIWNRELGKLAIEGGTERERTIFYTALYRAMGRPNDMTEAGDLFYSGMDRQVHPAEGHDFYVNDGFWDTYRSLCPLQLLLDPQRQIDEVRSLLRQYDEGGWLPTIPTLSADGASMIGHHATAFITDLYMKGYRDFDVEKAYAGMRKNATEATLLPWKRGPLTELDKVYMEKGFFPALAKGETESVSQVHRSERRQAVSVTLETAYDDWCLAQMAKALGKTDDYVLFMRRAHNYTNVFDKRIGFMAPKSADGAWVQGFDPKLGGGQGGRDYFTEMNSWTYTFQVQQDIPGLIDLLGGREAFVAKLDALFTEAPGTSKWTFLGQFPDMTGLIGQYSSGNEPSEHVAYLYNYAGQPWKTEFRLRQIMNLWYDDRVLGIPGDDDGGALSSWYVFSAMGFFPVTPGRPEYDLGSPIFSRVRISLSNGKTFAIVARHTSARNKYIQSAQLNGQPLNTPKFTHADIMGGGSLILEMGPRPNKTWGVAAEAVPPNG